MNGRALMTSEPLMIAVSSALMGVAVALLWSVGLSTLARRMETSRA